jgi:hypothetical protein
MGLGVPSPTAPAKSNPENKFLDRRNVAEKVTERKVTKEIFGRPALTHAGMAGGIVLLTFGWIAERRISFRDFFESVGGR